MPLPAPLIEPLLQILSVKSKGRLQPKRLIKSHDYVLVLVEKRQAEAAAPPYSNSSAHTQGGKGAFACQHLYRHHDQAENEVPHPQLFLAFGFSKTNPE